MWQRLGRMLVFVAIVPAPLMARQPEPQCSSQSVIVVLVGETSIPLSQTKTARIPYGKDLTVLIRTDAAATSVSLAYEFSGGSSGPRSGRVQALRASNGSCWAAPAPRVRLNETGSFTALIATPPKYKSGQSPTTFTVAVLLDLAALPSPLSPQEFAKRSSEGVFRAISASFTTPADSLFAPTDSAGWEGLQKQLSELVSREIQYSNVFNNVRNVAGKLSRAMPKVLKESTLNSRSVSGCPVGDSLLSLQASADSLRNASDTALAERIVRGGLPWPSCAFRLVSEFPDSGDPGRAAAAVRDLVNSQQLQDLLRLAAEIRALTQEVAGARTFEVPLGAGLLERYTQVDIVSAYMPAEDVAQAFAAATWYFFNPKGDYTGKIQPMGWGGDRFGIQLGYPVGTLSDSDTSFEPDLLLGLIGRINGVLSLSAGLVFGKDGSGESKEPLFFSLNVDLSNLGPLQDLFSRRDK